MSTTNGRVEWDCEGCGVHVYAFGIDSVPKHQMCITCVKLNEMAITADEFWQLHRRLNHGDSG